MSYASNFAHTPLGAVEYFDVPPSSPRSASAQTVLYFHGAGITADVMIPIEAPLPEAGFRLLLPNRPGYGATPLADNISAADNSHLAAALLDQLDLPRVALMGSSGGAHFALDFALRYPDRTAALVLLCPQLHRWSDRRWLPRSSRWTLPFLTRPWLRALLLAGYPRQFSRITPEKFLQLEAGARYPEVAADPRALEISAATIASMKRVTRAPGFKNDMRLYVDEDVLDDQSNLDVPTLVIHDELDPLAPVAHVDWFCSRVPTASRLTIRAAGHLVWAGPDAHHMHASRLDFLHAH